MDLGRPIVGMLLERERKATRDAETVNMVTERHSCCCLIVEVAGVDG
jgi:hypothetical protein